MTQKRSYIWTLKGWTNPHHHQPSCWWKAAGRRLLPTITSMTSLNPWITTTGQSWYPSWSSTQSSFYSVSLETVYNSTAIEEISETYGQLNYSWKCPIFLFICLIDYCFIFLAAAASALIIFTISRYRRLKTITNIFLASLASADLLLVTICVPVNVSLLSLCRAGYNRKI